MVIPIKWNICPYPRPACSIITHSTLHIMSFIVLVSLLSLAHQIQTFQFIIFMVNNVLQSLYLNSNGHLQLDHTMQHCSFCASLQRTHATYMLGAWIGSFWDNYSQEKKPVRASCRINVVQIVNRTEAIVSLCFMQIINMIPNSIVLFCVTILSATVFK